jgi:hypothetical protein
MMGSPLAGLLGEIALTLVNLLQVVLLVWLSKQIDRQTSILSSSVGQVNRNIQGLNNNDP